jgi:hypothetical protein
MPMCENRRGDISSATRIGYRIILIANIKTKPPALGGAGSGMKKNHLGLIAAAVIVRRRRWLVQP